MTRTATRTPARRKHGDLLAVVGWAVLVVAAAVVGWVMIAFFVGPNGPGAYTGWPPLWAKWAPHVGPGTVPALAVAVLVVVQGPQLAARLRWKRLLLLAYVASAAWIFFLALIDGWGVGIAERLTRNPEYLHDLPLIGDIGTFLAHFSEHIAAGNQPWTEHVAGHPPGITLIFVVLDRIGLGGGAIAGMTCILVGASAGVAVAVALRALGAEQVARRALPFAVLLPGAVWEGVSADAIFAAVAAWGVAAIAVGATGRGPWRDASSLAGGLLLGYTLYLSYGLVLIGLLPVAATLLTRRIRPLVIGGVGVIVVVIAFSSTGFLWWEGLAQLHGRYYGGIAGVRPYWYWVWANLAALALAVGPAVFAGLGRVNVRLSLARAFPQLATRTALQSDSDCENTAVVLVVAAVAAVLLADVSGLSKAEVERIWLPFAVWMVPVCAALPARSVRWWLAGQAVLALAVNHLLATGW